jgi:zinc/manganese transport system substrate-binding protein
MLRRLLTLVFVTTLAAPAAAGVNVFACEPEWAALAQEIGGDRVEAVSATTALQDPHRIQARPSLIARMRKADLVVCTGAGLEAGWLPLLLRRANNPRTQPGQPGYLEAATTVELLGRPQRLDRAEGDIHAEGNPHIQMSPHNLAVVARVLAERLTVIDSGNKAFYQARLDNFLGRWQASIERWEEAAASLHGMKFVVQHRSWVYLKAWLGLEVVATIEPKPGVPPTGGYLARLVEELDQQPAHAIIRAAYKDDDAALWLAERTGMPIVVLPFTVGGSESSQDLFSLFDDTLDRLLAVVPQQ